MSTDLTIREELSREKIELIKSTVAKGATDLELDLFLHACKRTGLDPLMKQIYAIKRWNSTERRETLSFQTGIDGYRLIADRTGRYAGSDEPAYVVGDDGLPTVATVTVYKMISGQRCGFSASARWSEYVQKTKDGQPTSMWIKMPFLMLGKCAEALALRKAFPAELSGVYTHEEMMQADEEPRQAVMDSKRIAQAKINELRQEEIIQKESVVHIESSPSANDLTDLVTAIRETDDEIVLNKLLAEFFSTNPTLEDKKVITGEITKRRNEIQAKERERRKGAA